MQYRTYEVQDGCRTGQIQGRTDAVKDGSRTGRMSTERLHDRMDAEQDRCSMYRRKVVAMEE